MQQRKIILPYRLAGHARASMVGFTLMELMIVVAIIAILAAIAIPSYSRYGYRARRDDGKNAIMRMANEQERYYTANNAYNTSAAAITSEKGYYSVSIASAGSSAQTYVITATPQGSQADDKCGKLTLTDTGVKKPDASNASANSNGSCW